jgi:hypothetical protein
MENQNQNQQSVCPNCGYCPCCGRSRFAQPQYPWTQPYITWGTSGQLIQQPNAQVTTTGQSQATPFISGLKVNG